MKPTKDANREDNIVSLAGHKKEKLHALNKEMYGEVIRTWRQYRGISQTQLTEALGLSRNLVSNWEAGRSRPDINIIPALCQALDISISAFFGIPGRPGELTVPEQRHISYYRMLNSDNQELVDAIIGNMLDQAARELRKRCERGFERTFKNAQLTAAGTGNPLEESRYGHYVYVRSDRNSCRADESITVTGNSMEPTFHDGDDLFIEHTETIEPGEIGIFIVNGDGFVKEYQPDGLHSHNPEYPVLHFSDGDDVRCVGRVLGVVDPDQYANDVELEMLEEIRHEKRTGK